jgi:hypothetical protein
MPSARQRTFLVLASGMLMRGARSEHMLGSDLTNAVCDSSVGLDDRGGDPNGLGSNARKTA